MKVEERLIDGTLQQDAVDFVITLRRFLKNKKPSFKELLNGALILESERVVTRLRTFDIRIIGQSHIQLRLIILF